MPAGRPDIGSIFCLIAGRQWVGAGSAGPRSDPKFARRFPDYDRPGRAAATNPDDDEEFLVQVRARAEAQRREYGVRRRRELEAEADQLRRRPEPPTG